MTQEKPLQRAQLTVGPDLAWFCHVVSCICLPGYMKMLFARNLAWPRPPTTLPLPPRITFLAYMRPSGNKTVRQSSALTLTLMSATRERLQLSKRCFWFWKGYKWEALLFPHLDGAISGWLRSLSPVTGIIPAARGAVQAQLDALLLPSCRSSFLHTEPPVFILHWASPVI